MEIKTEVDFLAVATNHQMSKYFTVMLFKEGGSSVIPFNFFRNWLDEDASNLEAEFYIGRRSGFSIGSIVKYDTAKQSLRVGRFVAGGLRLKFILNGQRETCKPSLPTC